MRVEIQFRFRIFPIQKGNISELVGQLIIAVSPLKIGSTQNSIPFRFILVGSSIDTRQYDIGIFDSLETLIPIPLHLVFSIILGLGRKHIVVKIDQSTAFVGLSVHGNVRSIIFGQNR